MKHFIFHLLFCISLGASCQITSELYNKMRLSKHDSIITTGYVGLNNNQYPTAMFIPTPKEKLQISIGGAIGRTDLYYPHGNAFDPFSVSVEISVANKFGYVQFRQSFMEDQPVLNNYANPGRNHLAWIEQLAIHGNIFKVGDFTTTAGAVLQYQWGDVSTKLTRSRMFPELGFSYEADERFAWVLRTSWFHYKPENRFGFMIGFRYQLKIKQ